MPKHQARGSSKSASKKAVSRSRLYDRANGFSLGCFLTLIRYGFARQAFRFHRSRVLEFASEIGMPIAIPTSQRAYDLVAEQVLQEATLWCQQESPEMASFLLLGTMAIVDASLRLSTEPVIEDIRPSAIDILTRHGLKGEALYDHYLAAVHKEANETTGSGRRGVHIDTFLTPAMHLLTGALVPLDTDPAMCFVAMPFKRPYADYFATFYRPLSEALDCLAFRMWGGLSGEAYVELMLMIMRHCHVVIADLSDLNANVLYEFGVARGLGKQVIPLCQRAVVDNLPSNIASDQLLLVYSPREKGWPEATTLRCAAQVFAIDLGQHTAQKAISGARWVKGDRLPTLADENEAATSV